VTQPGQPYQPNYQPQSWPPNPPQQAQGYPEPDGNYLGLQYTQPPSGQYPQQVATGHLRVNIQGSVMTSSFVPPTLFINNQVVRSSYGPNDYVLPAGQYHVSAYAQWMRRYGDAALDLVLQPGHAVEVFYAAPYNQFSSGSMGFAKQPRKGIGLLVGLLVAGIAALSLARWLTKPLTETAHAARKLAAGERGVALPAPASAEAAELTAALSALDRALATSEGRQREFLLSISHEMRTPLAAVRGYAEALSDGMISEDELPQVGQTLVRETERLDAFIRDLLELARLQADDFTIHPVPVELGTLLDHVRTAWSAKATTLQVALTVGGATSAPVVADPQRLRQVVDGLVENALRATPAGGRVSVTVRRGAGAFVVDVSDTGPGLAPEDARRRVRSRGAAREVPSDATGRYGPRPVDRRPARRADGWHAHRSQRTVRSGVHGEPAHRLIPEGISAQTRTTRSVWNSAADPP